MPTKFEFGNTWRPPLSFLVEHLLQDDGFLGDAEQIIGLEEDDYRKLAAKLDQFDGFLGRSELASMTSNLGAEADRIASIIYLVGGIIHEADREANLAMDLLADAIEEKAQRFSESDRKILSSRLRSLAAEPIGIAKLYKARELVDAVGSELDSFRVFCDIRPIFDRNRERIDGAIPLSIMRLEYSQPDGNSAVVEVRVTERQIEHISQTVADAKLKLRIIKQQLASQNSPIPQTKATVAEDNS
jgi:hypothetical protein